MGHLSKLARAPKPIFNHAGPQLRVAATKLQEMNRKVTLQWIPSHTGIFGNKIADKAAKRNLHSE